MDRLAWLSAMSPRMDPREYGEWRGAGLAVALLLAGCAVMPGRQPEGSPPDGDVGPVVDPVGLYDVTMSSQGRVSEGTIEIRGKAGSYRGTLVLGSVSAVLESVEAGAGVIHLRADMPGGKLVLRLTGDGRCYSGNWVLDMRRGTVMAEKRGEVEGNAGRILSAGC